MIQSILKFKFTVSLVAKTHFNFHTSNVMKLNGSIYFTRAKLFCIPTCRAFSRPSAYDNILTHVFRSNYKILPANTQLSLHVFVHLQWFHLLRLLKSWRTALHDIYHSQNQPMDNLKKLIIITRTAAWFTEVQHTNVGAMNFVSAWRMDCFVSINAISIYWQQNWRSFVLWNCLKQSAK